MQIEGQVTEVDESGKLITNIAHENLAAAPRDAGTTIRFGGHETVCLYQSDHDEPESTLIAVLGDSGFLEIEIVGMNLAEMLGIPPGVEVQVCWE